MEVIIGRKDGTNQLSLKVGNKVSIKGPQQSVNDGVSRENHCKLTVNDDGTFTIENLKPQNQTLVNGLPIASKRITPNDVVELGWKRYRLDWNLVFEVIPKMVNISHLRLVKQRYDEETQKLTVKQGRANALRSITSVLSMGAIALGIFGVANNNGSDDGFDIRIVLYALAILLTVGFTIKSFIDASKLPQQRKDLQDWFTRNYTCPNCGKFMGNQDYDHGVSLMECCPACKAKFIKG
ncbi:MAG: FHA domain-containing protein [Muribaculaceae bacterium]|nr:FHA domain-containing protein [Muribaculaceae bacterium]